MRVRVVAEGEWERLRAFRLRALASDPRAFGRTLAEEAAEPPDAWRARTFAPGRRAVLVAEEGDAWLGMVGVHWRDSENEGEGEGEGRPPPEVWGMWTAPEGRGRGIGRALVDAAAQVARGWGAQVLILWVNTEMSDARRLYARAGFADEGEPWQGTRDPSRRFQMMARRL